MASAAAEAIAEIMKAYEKFGSEIKIYQDRVSGATVRQLTSYLGDSWHSYFTNNGFWDNNKRLLFSSERNNVRNLFSIELESGEISRLTDFKPGDSVAGFPNDCNPKLNEVYFVRDNVLYAHDLVTLETRPLYKCPDGFTLSAGMSGADGKYVYGYLNEDLSSRIYTNMNASYIGFQETFEAKPDSRIIRIDVENGRCDEIWQEYYWLDHVNPSPTMANMITFTHEGPWGLVDHRMWTLDVNTGKATMLRPRKMEGEAIGHEYWFADGIKVGYQAHTPEGNHYFGMINYDGTEEYEGLCVPVGVGLPDHIHSVDHKLIVSDAGKTIKLYRFNGVDYDEARVLCMHDGSFFMGHHHPHPKVLTNGKQVLYNSNCMGYCNMYLADIPEDVLSLPKVVDVEKFD